MEKTKKRQRKEVSVRGPLTSKFRTICEVHREIYDMLETLKDKKKRKEIESLLQEAFMIGRDMAYELFEFKGKDKELFYKEMEYKHNLDYKYKKRMRRMRLNG